MPVKKRLFQQGAIPNSKRQRKTHDDFFQSQDLWKNLDRVRTSYNEAESVMKNSCLFITVFTKSAIAEYKSCLKSLHEYVDAEKLQLIELEADYGFIMLKSFTLLDCCLVFTVLFALKNKRWIAANSSEYFNIPSNVALAGCIYLRRTLLELKRDTNLRFPSLSLILIVSLASKSYHLVLRAT